MACWDIFRQQAWKIPTVEKQPSKRKRILNIIQLWITGCCYRQSVRKKQEACGGQHCRCCSFIRLPVLCQDVQPGFLNTSCKHSVQVQFFCCRMLLSRFFFREYIISNRVFQPVGQLHISILVFPWIIWYYKH